MNEALWTPSPERVAQTEFLRYLRFVNKRMGLALSNMAEAYRWSVEDIPGFWESIWHWADIRASSPYDKVVEDLSVMPGTVWFPGARLNFAENLLRRRDEREAIAFYSERGPERRITYAALYAEVARLAQAMKQMGIRQGDRVAGYVPNMPEAVMAMLAATSLGAVWSSCSPDFGVNGAVDRFGQIRPRLLVCADGYRYNGKAFARLAEAQEIAQRVDSIETVVVKGLLDERPDLAAFPHSVGWEDFLGSDTPPELEFVQQKADHPVYILYSSGTTGKPKCITHGAIGTLLQHYKELSLHADLRAEDTLFYFTTCGWMMWNWLVSGLMLGLRIVLFDGSPFAPSPEGLWRMAEAEGVSLFGTSAKYLAALEATGLKPRERFDLSALRILCSTGSPLSAQSFRYVYRDIKTDVQLASISGGTDIVSCFMLGDPTAAVYEEEIQCRGLGMKVEAWEGPQQPVVGHQGELVCTAPAPSMPVAFWNDPDMAKYKAAYFEHYPGVWRHGDFIELTARGSVKVFGRSDATLNPGGVRIGTAEIYNQMETLPEIADSLVIGQDWQDDVRVILFVKLVPGQELTEDLRQRIRTVIRNNTTPRHVPAKILAVADIPYTLNGKKVELAVRQIVHGKDVQNREALANPQALECFRDLADLQQ